MNGTHEDIPVLTIGDKNYELGGATVAANQLLQNLELIQMEAHRVKTQLDIINVAKNAVVIQLKQLIDSGESGLIEVSEPEIEVDTEASEDK
jgi:hypothetical protein